MIRATRRAALGGALLGALAVPAMPSMVRRLKSGKAALLHDPALEAGRRFAAAGHSQGLASVAIEGDRVRFMREVLQAEPSLVFGVSRHGDAQLLEDIAREDGYMLAASSVARRTPKPVGPFSMSTSPSVLDVPAMSMWAQGVVGICLGASLPTK